MTPTISVIVPVFRVEAFLRPCVDSLLAQTHTALDVILVDDGSPDGCPALCDAYAAADARVRVLHRANGGLSDARNAGLDAARGEYIAFLDGDDALSPVFLELLLRADADVAQCGFCREADGLEAVRTALFSRFSGREASERLAGDRDGICGVVWNKLFRRELFRCLRFPAGRRHEDEFLTYRLLWAARNVAVTDAKLYFYRRREGSLTRCGFSARSLDAPLALEERERFYRACGEERLAVLTQATYCHRLRALLPELRRAAPDAAALWERKLCEACRDVLASPLAGPLKKAALCLRMASPALYDALRPRGAGDAVLRKTPKRGVRHDTDDQHHHPGL